VAGVIDQRFVSNGTQVTFGTGGTPLAQVVVPGLKLKFTLPEQQVAVVRQKTRLAFGVSAYPGREFGATVYYISELADPKTRLVTCWATVDKTDAILKAGFFTKIHIVTEERERAAVVPLTAVLPTERGFVTFVVEDGRARQRPVTLGLQVVDKAVEVKQGLKEGENLVVEGANALRDGARVKEVDAAPKAEATPPAPDAQKASAAGAQEKSR
jgi:membrane fusion protein, multidrug efflux system